MKHQAVRLATLSVILFSIAFHRAEAQTAAVSDPELTKEIRQLLAKIHIQELVVSSMRQMVEQLRTQQADKLPSELFSRFESKFDSLGSVMVDSVVPIYAKYYSRDEVRELNKLYDLPILQKGLRVMPQVMAESMAVGSNIGRQTMTAVATEYLSEHPELLKDEPELSNSAPKKKKKK